MLTSASAAASAPGREETSGTGAQVRFAGGYTYLPLSDAFRAAFEKIRGISIPAGKSWVRFPAPLRPGSEVTLINQIGRAHV